MEKSLPCHRMANHFPGSGHTIAMEHTGATLLLAAVTSLAGPLGPYAILAALVLLSRLLS